MLHGQPSIFHVADTVPALSHQSKDSPTNTSIDKCLGFPLLLLAHAIVVFFAAVVFAWWERIPCQFIPAKIPLCM
jgi:hypothetical protein